MKKLVIELCCVIALAACGNGKEQKTLEEDATAKALLQGVWINDETELPLMRIEGDTIYYADPQNIPVSFKMERFPFFSSFRISTVCTVAICCI